MLTTHAGANDANVMWKPLPIAEEGGEGRCDSTDMSWFYLDGGGGVRGPVSALVLQARIQSDVVVQTSMVSRQGVWAPLTDWQSMGWLLPHNNDTIAEKL